MLSSGGSRRCRGTPAGARHRAVQPEPADQERRRGAQAGDPSCAKGRCRAPVTPRPAVAGRRSRTPARRRRLPLCASRGRRGTHRPFRRFRRRSEVDRHPAFGQVARPTAPQGLGKRFGRHVEEQAFVRTQEVQVEHHGQFGRGKLAGIGEEAAREHFERQVPRRFREIDALEERRGVEVVQPLVDAGHLDRRQRQRGAPVEGEQVPEPESGAAQGERERVQRRSAGQAAEGVGAAAGVQQRVVRERGQPSRPGSVRVSRARRL